MTATRPIGARDLTFPRQVPPGYMNDAAWPA
jgi:hypothetical protein